MNHIIIHFFVTLAICYIMSNTVENQRLKGKSSPEQVFARKTELRILRDKTNVNGKLSNSAHKTTKPKAPQKEDTASLQHMIVAFKSAYFKVVCPFPVQRGEYIIVECDRGLRCGKVLRVLNDNQKPGSSFDEINFDNVKQEYRVPGETLGKVIRVATMDDRRSYEDLKYLELHALRVCTEFALEMRLPCELIGCEFQFDRTKVTFFFRSEAPIDFRVLVRELYKIFGVRIWMQNVNLSVRNEMPDEATNESKRMSPNPLSSSSPGYCETTRATHTEPSTLPSGGSTKPYFDAQMVESFLSESC